MKYKITISEGSSNRSAILVVRTSRRTASVLVEAGPKGWKDPVITTPIIGWTPISDVQSLIHALEVAMALSSVLQDLIKEERFGWPPREGSPKVFTTCKELLAAIQKRRPRAKKS